MQDESSIYDAEPEDLDRLVFEILGEPEAEEHLGSAATAEGILEQLGGRIGRYKLLSVLGEGGMGIVYLAEQQEPIRRKVALKVIKPGMDSKRVMARFEAERQALALLDHPNIAHVYDAGTTEGGRPYFVMEHVKGLPVTEHCDKHKLTIEQRLRLFQQVCQAVQHAHQKGIIHRDIKPSNILVSTQDDQAAPKIIDFGVAKALAQPFTERTLATEDSQLLGTPEYMSPEQADMATEDIDTRSDIYSLGVLLYVLLAGILPYDSKTFREGGVEHIRRIIHETDPKTPSTRLTKLGEEARKLAENRRMEIHALARHLKKELEWIPLKAMRKERSERYRSASEMADDIENYLNGEPLIAGSPGTGYRLKKFVRRNRILVGGSASLLVALVAGAVISAIFAIRAERARAEAQLIADFLQKEVLGVADEAKVGIGEATVSFSLDNASNKLPIYFKGKPLIEASITRTLAETYRQLGQYKKAEDHFLHATRIYREHLGPEHPVTLSTEGTLAYVYQDQGRYRDMELLCTRILAIQQRLGRVLDQCGTRNGLGAAYLFAGKYEDAARVLEVALELEGAWREQRAKGFDIFPYIRGNLARVYTAQGRYEEAEQLFAKTEYRATGVLYGLASLYREQGRYSEAETLFKESLESVRQLRGDENFGIVLPMDCFAHLYIDQGRYKEAETLLDEALSIARRRMHPNHPVTLDLVNARAVLHTKQKRYEDAQSLFKEALESRRRELGDDHPDTLETINDLGILHRQQEHYEKAEKLLTEALEGKKIKLGPNHPHTLQSIHELGVLYKEQGLYDKAESRLREAAQGRLEKLGAIHPHTSESWNNLIDLYDAWNKPEKAEEWRAKLQQMEAVEE
jgi:serine/threonine protein kinase